KTMVDDILKAPSEDEALGVVESMAREYPAGGPDRAAVVRNQKAHRMRMVLPQVINMRPPEELFEADKAADDEKLWREVRRVAENQLDYYERMAPTTDNRTYGED